MVKEEKEKHPQNHILIFGDEYVRTCASKITTLLNSDRYNEEGIVTPHVEVSVIGQNIFKYTKFLTEKDFVVITVNTNNISNHRSLNTFTTEILHMAKYTNLLNHIKCNSPEDQYE